jgi:alpha-tubulin suppressor-like RCC1 family protein
LLSCGKFNLLNLMTISCIALFLTDKHAVGLLSYLEATMRYVFKLALMSALIIGCNPDSTGSENPSMDAAIIDGASMDGASDDSTMTDAAAVDSATVDVSISDGAVQDGAVQDGAVQDAAMDMAVEDMGPSCDAPQIICGNECINPRTDLRHCGACDSPCALAGATSVCVEGACTLGECQMGRGDCDGAAANGCEMQLGTVENCVRCGDRCETADICDGQCSSAVVDLFSDENSGCLLRASGHVECWGDSGSGLLGTGSPHSSSNNPLPVAIPAPIRELADGPNPSRNYGCAVSVDDDLYCWGNLIRMPGYPQRPDGGLIISQPIRVRSGIARVFTDKKHQSLFCEILTAGGVRCYSNNEFWVAGDPEALMALDDVIDMAVHGHTILALRQNGQVLCWGNHEFTGRCGFDNVPHDQPFPIPGVDDAVKLSGMCALRAAGTVVCLNRGVLEEPQNLPPLVVDIDVFEDGERGCALDPEGGAHCWGPGWESLTLRNGGGPVELPGPIARIWTGLGGCAADVTGQLFCWDRKLWRRRNLYDSDTNYIFGVAERPLRQCINPERIDCEDTCVDLQIDPRHCGSCGTICPSGRCVEGVCADEPCADCNPSAQIQVAVGAFKACSRLADGHVRCWGGQSPGYLGGYRPWDDVRAPLATVENVVEIEVGGQQHTCTLVDADSEDDVPSAVWCWGPSSAPVGPLESGQNSAVPAPVSGVEGAISIDLGPNTSCAVMADHTVRCWGGDFVRSDPFVVRSRAPIPMAGADVAEVRFGQPLRCYRHTDGDVSCWDIFRHREDGVTRLEGLGAVALDVGYEHACAVLGDGTVRCWGAGEGGQLGHGQTVDSAVPVAVQGIVGNVVQVSAGEVHTCARTDRGQVWCWGQQVNSVIGLLGNRSGRSSSTAVQVRFLEDATDISVGPAAACATRTNGEVMCWGGRLWHEEVLEGVYNAFAQPAPRPVDLPPPPPMNIACDAMCQHVSDCAPVDDLFLPNPENCHRVCNVQIDDLRQCVLDISCQDMSGQAYLACFEDGE